MAAMARGDIDLYDSLFRDACPKFVTSTPPAYDQATTNTNQLVRGGRRGRGEVTVGA